MGKQQKQAGGRKPIPIDEVLLEKLTKLQLSDRTIASILCVHEDTLHNRFSEKMNGWRDKSKGKIAEVLFDEAVNKREPWALKMISQRHLGYYDKVKTEVTGSTEVKTITESPAEQLERIKSMLKDDLK